jgi:hypothetical protein
MSHIDQYQYLWTGAEVACPHERIPNNGRAWDFIPWVCVGIQITCPNHKVVAKFVKQVREGLKDLRVLCDKAP